MKLFFAILVVLLSLVVAFYFWASSASLHEQDYSKAKEYEKYKAPANDSIFTIVTFNIGYCSGMSNNTSNRMDEEFYQKNLQKVLLGLDPYKPDIIGLQEIDFGSARSYEVNQMDEMAEGLGFQYAASAINWDKKYVPFPYFPPSVHFGKMLSGQAILSRFPISKTKRTVLQKVESQPFYYKKFYLDRLIQMAEIEIQGQKVIVLNVHLEAFDKETRLKQTQKVREVLKSYSQDYPVLLIGDFNSVPPYKENLKPTIEVLLNDPEFANACPQSMVHMEGSYTYPTGSPNEQLDYIFFNKDKIELLEWKVITKTEEASDHFPLMMRFRLKQAAKAQENEK